MKFAVSMLAILMATTAAASAADLIIEEPVAVDIAAPQLSGVIELGISGVYTENDSDPFEGSAAGAFISGAISGGSDGFLWGIDGLFEGAGFETADEAPTYTALIGAHLGYGTDFGRIGGFASFGAAPDRNDDNQTGYTVGIEGLASFDSFSLFGQLGWADINTDTSDDAEDAAGLIGPFIRVGGLVELSDEFAVMADLGYGTTEHFTDDDDPGHYFAAGVKAAVQLPVDFDLYATAAYEYGYYAATGDDQSATSHTVKLGLAIPFGDTTAAGVLNPLATTAQPYRGALFGSILD
jgi:hypothetical protein